MTECNVLRKYKVCWYGKESKHCISDVITIKLASKYYHQSQISVGAMQFLLPPSQIWNTYYGILFFIIQNGVRFSVPCMYVYLYIDGFLTTHNYYVLAVTIHNYVLARFGTA